MDTATGQILRLLAVALQFDTLPMSSSTLFSFSPAIGMSFIYSRPKIKETGHFPMLFCVHIIWPFLVSFSFPGQKIPILTHF